MSWSRGRLPGASATSSRSAPNASPRPTTPPTSAERHALHQQLAGDPSRAGAERRAHRELLLPRLGADQQQVGDVRARDEQHHADRAHQHPQHALDVADEVVLQRPDVRRDARLLEHLDGCSPGTAGTA